MNTRFTSFDDAFVSPFFTDFHKEYNSAYKEKVDIPLYVTAKELKIYEDQYTNGFSNKAYLYLFALFCLFSKVKDGESTKIFSRYAIKCLYDLKARVVDYKTGKKHIDFISDDYYIIIKSVKAIENYLGIECNFHFVEIA